MIKMDSNAHKGSCNIRHDYTIITTITRKVSRLHVGYDNYTKGTTVTRCMSQLHERF